MSKLLVPSRRRFLHTAALGLAACGAPVSRGGRPDRASPDGGPAPTHATSGGTAATSTAPSRRPNIVYIFADQHRGDVVGAFGNPAAITPNLDRLAAEGVAFPSSFTNAPSCRPSRNVMMQRLYVTQTGIWDNRYEAPPDSPSHVRRMRDEAGYFTMVVGKTHLYDAPDGPDGHTDNYKHNLGAWGFSDSLEVLGPTEQTLRPSTYTDWLTANTPVGGWDKYEAYSDYVNNYVWESPPPDVAPWLLGTADHMDTYVADNAAEFIRNYAGEEPFYLQVNFPGPHKPFDSTTEFRALFDTATTPFPEPILALPEDPSPLIQQMLGVKYVAWERQAALDLALTYYAKIMMVDVGVGKVLAALEEAGQLDNTWIVYHSDHGELLADHMLTGKVVMYEGAIHVPLIIRPPAGVDPWVCHGLTDTADVAATLVELAQLPLEGSGFPGQSLLQKILAGEDAPDAQVTKEQIFSTNVGSTAVRTDRYKLVYDRDLDAITDLYDLQEDPEELFNRKQDPDYRDVRDDLMQRILDEDALYPPIV